jgi:hypothetical protein
MTIPGISLPNDRYRRAVGFGLGALIGVTYAAAYQVGDRITIPGIPLYQPPFGLAGNLLMFALGGGLLGLIAAWPRSGIAGTFLAAAVSAVALVASAYISAGTTGENVAGNVFNGSILALPFWGLLVVMIGPLRWVISHEEEARRDRQPLRRRVLRPLIMLLVVGLAGLTALYPSDARVLLRKENEMLRAAQATGTVPASLASTAFATRGRGPYQLSWERERIERYRIPRPAGNLGQHSVVVARFSNGWNLVCLYVNQTDPPRCQDMEVLPP